MLSEVITGNQLSWDIVSLPDEYLKEEALSKAKAYLVSTDMKLMPYYDFDVGDLSLEEYVAERKVARDFIRSIEDS
jgi:hypothetical protein